MKFPRGCCLGTGDRTDSLKEGGPHKDPANFSLHVTAEEQDWSKLAVQTARRNDSAAPAPPLPALALIFLQHRHGCVEFTFLRKPMLVSLRNRNIMTTLLEQRVCMY